MSERKTTKKVTKVDLSKEHKTTEKFVPSPENKKKSTNQRLLALLLWAVAIGLEVWAILLLKKPPVNMPLMIGLLIGDGILAIGGSLLWKQANRLDPASEKDAFRFFVQNQLGFLIAIIAFVPLIVLILLNKDLKGKDKGILAVVAIAMFAVAAYFGWDFNPISSEQVLAETSHVVELMGEDHVYWTKSGKKYHLYEDCHTINKDVTTEIFEGKVADAYAHKHIDELCKICENRAVKAKEAGFVLYYTLA